MRVLRLGLLTALLLGLVAGCPKNPNAPARVSGMVTYNSKPVTAGTITFHMEDKGRYPATLGPDGTYEITDIPTGTMVVTVETESQNPDKKTQEYGGGRGGQMDAKRMAAERQKGAAVAQGSAAGQYVKIPPRYANPRTSPLKETLAAGRQVKSIDLTD